MRYFVGKVNSTFGWDTRAHLKKRSKVKKILKLLNIYFGLKPVPSSSLVIHVPDSRRLS